MATKRKANGGAARKSAKGVGALADALDSGARTIVYVHGIGNKPIASVLKCQWDRALFGFDLGERSRLSYWVNRAFYPEPEDATCEAGDRIEVTPHGAGTRALSAAQTGRDEVAETIAELAKNKNQQATLRSIADAMGAFATALPEETLRTRAIGAKVVPLPAPARGFLTKRLTDAFLRDVHEFFFVEDRRKAMEASVLERLRPGGGPFVVIGHSQGSMIAYKVLSQLAAADFDVRLFVTIGSPLGITEVQDQLELQLKTRKLAVPACVKSWLNVADPLDPVALDKRIGNDYAATNGVEVDDNVEFNPDSPRHPHSGSGYLSTRPVRRAVKAAVDTALFQTVSPFTIARDVARDMEDAPAAARHEVLIELAEVSATSGTTLAEARRNAIADIRKVSKAGEDALAIESMERFVAALLTREEAETLAGKLGGGVSGAALSMRRIWKNATKRALLNVSGHTVQAIPARNAYETSGRDIHWAVLDTGIFADHPHFKTHDSIVASLDCTSRGAVKVLTGNDRNSDGNGHGTHVAGIISGSFRPGGGEETIAGVAPQAKLHIYKVLDDEGSGKDSWIIKALDHVASVNANSPRPLIHGLNLSLGGGFDQSAYACGHTPLCRELRRLWQQGVAVVIAAGNEGFAVLESEEGPIDANMDISIGDPANLDEAIAVGSVHKERPHMYGVSYFSSRGPTADGRMKPDLVAPGERILSCRHKPLKSKKPLDNLYVAMSGTSMAAPHVSGVIAAFLSKRQEFIGYPDNVKEILLGACTDLKRDRAQQGSGLVNLLKMLVAT
jgi:subtilisin family serine protease